jgi:hypothetical protein
MSSFLELKISKFLLPNPFGVVSRCRFNRNNCFARVKRTLFYVKDFFDIFLSITR